MFQTCPQTKFLSNLFVNVFNFLFQNAKTLNWRVKLLGGEGGRQMKSDFNFSHIIDICNLNYAKKYAEIVYYLWVPEETVLILYNTCTIISSQPLYNIWYYAMVLLSIIYLILYNICCCTMVLLISDIVPCMVSIKIKGGFPFHLLLWLLIQSRMWTYALWLLFWI